MARNIKLKAAKCKVIGAQISSDLSMAVDIWIEKQPEPKPTRSDVLRFALEEFIGPTPSQHHAPDPVEWRRGPASPVWR